MKLFCYCLVTKSRYLYCDPMDPTVSLCMVVSRQEY